MTAPTNEEILKIVQELFTEEEADEDGYNWIEFAGEPSVFIEFARLMFEKGKQSVSSELERLKRYDEELSKVMPEDYKDWHQNTKEDWPIIARYSIESLREREEWALDTLAQFANNKDS